MSQAIIEFAVFFHLVLTVLGLMRKGWDDFNKR